MFYIPSNYDDSGRLFNGMFKTRNFVESVVIVFLLFKMLGGMLTGVSWKIQIAVNVVILSPVAVFGIIGINEDSLTQFIGAFFRFLKNRKRLRYRRIDKHGFAK